MNRVESIRTTKHTTFRRRATRLAAAAVLALAALAAPPRVARTEAQIPADTFDLPEIVVTATRMPHHRDAVPVAVTVLTGEELRASGVRSVAEALRRTPSATVVSAGSDGAQTSLFLRGGESDYVKVLVDGVPVNEPGGTIDLADLSVTNIERIEIVRGPTSVLYGSDAVTGVVQIFTRRGRGAPQVSVTALPGLGARRRADGSYNTFELDAHVAGGDDRLSYSLGFSRFDSQGLLPLNNAYDNTVAGGRLAVSPATGTDIAVTGRYRDARYHYPTDGAGRVVDENAFQDTELRMLAVEAAQRISDRVRVRTLVGTAETRRFFDDAPDGPADTLGTFAGTGDQTVRRLSADARLDVLLDGDGAVISLGATTERGGMVGETEYRSAFGPFTGSVDEERSTTGVYGQLVAGPVPGLDLQLGVRREEAATFGTFDTWRIAAAYDLPLGLRARASFGTAFREPSFGESFGSGFGDTGNPDLTPERTRSWEAALERDFAGARISATWYDQHFTDLIQYTFATEQPGDPNYFNVAGAAARGLELSGSVPVTSRLGLEAQATVLDTEVTDQGLASDASFVEGQPLLRRPALAARLAARYGWDRGSVRVAADHTGERDDVDYGAAFPYPRVTLGPVTTLELSAEHTWATLGQEITLLARVDNLLDAEYQQIAGFPGPGRTARLGVRVAF